MPLDIVYEDEDIMVINKPFIFRCVNRLDRDTSGLTIIAKNMLSTGILSSMVA